MHFVSGMNALIIADGSLLYAGTFVCFAVLHNASPSILFSPMNGLFLITPNDQTLRNSSCIFHLQTV